MINLAFLLVLVLLVPLIILLGDILTFLSPFKWWIVGALVVVTIVRFINALRYDKQRRNITIGVLVGFPIVATVSVAIMWLCGGLK